MFVDPPPPRALLIAFKIGVIHIDINNVVCTISLVCLARTVAQVAIVTERRSLISHLT